MRGDSRLDFFAKSLALAGLGLVGATGALIDYWPATIRLPQVAAINLRRATSLVQTSIDLRGLDLEAFPGRAAPIDARTKPLSPRGAPERTATRFFSDEWPDDSSRLPKGAGTNGPGRLPVAELALASVLPAVNLTADAAGAPDDARGNPLDDARGSSTALENWQPMTPPAVAADRSDDGFFSGMLKKTGSSVSTSIGKASNSLVGAVRAVGDAVKRAF